jgi:hypothetical protein
MCNFKPAAGPFFIFLAMNCLTVLLAITMGLFISSLSTKLPVVQLATPALNIVFVLFAGFLLPLPSIPEWFIWIHWISYATYVFAVLTINEFKGLQFSCTPGITSGCYANGQEFLDTYDLETVRTLFHFSYLCDTLSLPLAFFLYAYSCYLVTHFAASSSPSLQYSLLSQKISVYYLQLLLPLLSWDTSNYGILLDRI